MPGKISVKNEEGKWVPARAVGGRTLVDIHLWNSETLAWEAGTKGSGAGQAVSVENFPAAVSGVAQDQTLDPLAKYKITDIDSTEGNSYFGYTDKDGKWVIMNLTAAAARYVKGDSGYTTAWGNKGGLNYDYFYNVF